MNIQKSINKIVRERESKKRKYERVRKVLILVTTLFLGIFIGSFFLQSDFSITGFASGALPTIGESNWGTILNNYLLQEHTTNGTHGNVTAENLNVSGNFNLSGDLIAGNSNLFVNSTNVGIGTTSPVANLHISDASAGVNTPLYASLIIEGTAVGRFINFQTLASGNAGMVWGDPNDEDVAWFYYDHISNNFRVRSSGLSGFSIGDNVGIGVFPTEKLDVAGNAKISGNLNVTGNVTISGNISQSETPEANTLYAKALPKAWVNFDGTSCSSSNGGSCVAGSCTMRGSFNVECVNRTTTGQYIVYWDRDFANANYALSYGQRSGVILAHSADAGEYLVGSVSIHNRDDAAAFRDDDRLSVIAFGEQA